MKLVEWGAIALLFYQSGCATYQSDDCPSLASEPVSGCRARVKCQTRKKTNYAVGLRSPAALLPENFGVDMGQSPVTEIFNDCVTRDLQEQEATSLINKKEIL